MKSLINLFFPQVCYACSHLLSDNEDGICVNCRHELPTTGFHFYDNEVVKNVLYGRANIENATALFRFEKKGIVQNLIHGLKYRGYENIGILLGDWLGNELCNIAAYRDIDIVIPVPLHEQKLKQRGYNQVAKFGQRIAIALNAKYMDDVLVKITNTTSQTARQRLARWNKSDELFALKNISFIEHKHILLVDDIITTGATLEACASVLCQAKQTKISIATMAIA